VNHVVQLFFLWSTRNQYGQEKGKRQNFLAQNARGKSGFKKWKALPEAKRRKREGSKRKNKGVLTKTKPEGIKDSQTSTGSRARIVPAQRATHFWRKAVHQEKDGISKNEGGKSKRPPRERISSNRKEKGRGKTCRAVPSTKYIRQKTGFIRGVGNLERLSYRDNVDVPRMEK